MIIKSYKPYTPTRRALRTSSIQFSKDIDNKVKLRVPLQRSYGRNNKGSITSRHKGGGHKYLYRIIDFKRNKFDVYGKIIQFVYDPNRNVSLALVIYEDGEQRYILNIAELKINDTIMSYNKRNINHKLNLGDTAILKNIGIGSFIHNIEINSQHGGQLCRAAGTYAIIIAQDTYYTSILLNSHELRLLHNMCRATIGKCAHAEFNQINSGKAGRTRWLGQRPTVRGSAMNALDHPHGGGEGKCPIGKANPRTPWGKIAFGLKTRQKRNKTNPFILQKNLYD